MAKGRQRSTKWYFQNEKEVIQELGLTPTKGSGSNWVEKEDGENDHVLAQLKSTDHRSYKLNQLDLEKLEYHASVSNKIPMFVIQFLNNDSRYALVQIEDIPLLAEYIKTGEIQHSVQAPIIDLEKPKKPKQSKPKVVSSKSARDKFYKEKQQAFEERKYKK